MKFAAHLVIGLLFASVLSVEAYAAGGEFSGILIDNNTFPSLSPSAVQVSGFDASFSGTASPVIGAGILIATPSADSISFEAGLLYLNRRYVIQSKVPAMSSETQNDTYSQTALEVPLLVRWNIANFFALGAGGYYAYGFGSVTRESDGKLSTPVAKKTTSGSYSDMNLTKADYGLLVSAAVKIHYEQTRAVLIELRYALGLNNVNTDKSSTSPPIVEKYNDVQLILGIQRTF